MLAALTAGAHEGEIALFLAAGGATGTELATRLACRAGGTVLTDALSIELREGRLHGRRNVYSNHLVGRFALSARPWCVTTDASWNDEPGPASLEHAILSDTHATGAPPHGVSPRRRPAISRRAGSWWSQATGPAAAKAWRVSRRRPAAWGPSSAPAGPS
jgi:electron transfer flavoprotein alpha subunit